MIEEKKKILTPQQELFCQLYTSEGEGFSNATTSYSIAYNYDFASLDTKREIDEKGKEILGTSEEDKARHYCQVAGSRLMLNARIRERVRELLLEMFNKDDFSDSRLQTIIIKGKDADAINAIKHRNDLKQRVTKKVDVTTLGRPLAGLSDEELQAMIGT